MSISQNRATRRPSTSIDDLLSRVSLTELVERYTGAGRASGNTLTYSCPNPNHADRRPSFTIQTTAKGERGKCWSACDWHGDALDFVKWQEGLSTGDALKWLRDYVGGYRQPAEPKKVAPLLRSAVAIVTEQPTQLDPATEARLLAEYLRGRNWPSQVIKQFALSVVVDNWHSKRVRHPYYQPTTRGDYVMTWYQDRAIEFSSYRWTNPTDRATIPYNLKALEADEIDTIVICEGAPDTITATLAIQNAHGVAAIGIPGASNWRREYAELLTNKNVIIAADNDTGGDKLAQAIQRDARHTVTRVLFPHGDITDTAKQVGLDAVSELLLARRAPLDVAPLTQDQALALLLRAFPEAVTL